MQVASVLSTFRRRISRPFLHRLMRPWVEGAISRPSDVHFLGHRLRTDPGVFHPLFFSSSRILVEEVLRRPLRGLSVLDMGSGAGPATVAFAAAGASVTACDVNPRAVTLTRENSARNGLSGHVMVIESNLFSSVEDHRFDLICFNIPFYPRDPTTHFEAAFLAGKGLEVVRRFAEGCADHLAEGGRIVIVYSEDCDEEVILAAFAENARCLESKITVRRLLEDFHVAWFK